MGEAGFHGPLVANEPWQRHQYTSSKVRREEDLDASKSKKNGEGRVKQGRPEGD